MKTRSGWAGRPTLRPHIPRRRRLPVRTLVTGSHGFLGRHLVAALRQRGDEVVEPRGDLRKPETLAGAGQVDLVYHLAAQSHVPTSVQDPVGTWENNVGSTLQLLEWARKAEPRRVVLMSSAHVYGPAKGHPLRENHPFDPRSPYGASKVATEALGQAYGAAYGLDVVRVRPFNVYGPGQAPGFLVPDIMGPLAEGRAPTLGNPNPRRDFTYVEDAITMLLAVGQAPAARGEALNLCSGTAVPVGDVARIACKVAGTGHPPSFRDQGAGDELAGDAGKAYRVLAWSPRIGLEEGLRRTWEQMRSKGPAQRQDAARTSL